MRRVAGTLFMVFAMLGVAGAVLMAGGSILEMGRTYPTSDRYAAAEGVLLLAGAVLALAAILFVTGWYLRQPRPEAIAEIPGNRRRKRLVPLVLYLGGSIGIGLLAGWGSRVLPSLGPLALLICQPTFFVQILLGGFLELKLTGGAVQQGVFLVSNLLYFAALFYPIYSMIVMDRAIEVARYRRMKTILILFGSVHLLIALALLAIMKA